MTELLVAALAHSPGITGFPDRPSPDVAERAMAGVLALRDRIAAYEPDVVVGISNDHFTATTPSCLAPFAIAMGASFRSPATPRLAEFLQLPQRRIPGRPDLARRLVEDLYVAGIDVAQLAGRFAFDENFAVPLHLLDLADTPIIPVIVNAVEAPMPTPRRCVDVGTALGAALHRQCDGIRLAVIATGGLSHSVGTPAAGTIDVAFDKRVLDLMTAGDLGAMGELDDAMIVPAGNGAAEVRQWLVAAGVAGGPLELLGYEPVPEWLTGVAVVCSPP